MAKRRNMRSVARLLACLASMGVPWSNAVQAQENCPMRGDVPYLSPCVLGDCDNPSVRNLWLPPANYPMTVRLKFIVFGDGIETFATTTQKLNAQMVVLNQDFFDDGIQFVMGELPTFVHDANVYYLCSECDYPPQPNDNCCFHQNYMCRGDCDGAPNCPATKESALKSAYADNPGEWLNIYVVNASNTGFVGLGYFPWCADATANPGGIIVHGPNIGGDTDCGNPSGARCGTLTHEIGHNLGLWHTYHRVSEVGNCSSCYEYPDGQECWERGDMCCDTPATPLNFFCSDPQGVDECRAESFGDTNEANHMAFIIPGCADHFTSEQAGRMHCWTCNAASGVSGWIEGGDCNNNGTKDVCDINGGASQDCNGNGIPEECEPFVDCNNNEVRDSCDISSGTSGDCNADGIPDECQQRLLYGACCIDGGPPQVCVDTAECACWDLGGNFAGVGTQCATTNCLIIPNLV